MPITITLGNQTGFTPRTAFDDAAIMILHLVEVAEHQTLRVMGDVAHEYSSGTATEKMLGTAVAAGGLGHPYGFGPDGAVGPRGPIPNGGDPAVINIQTGEFASGWKEEVGHFQNGEMINALVNETEHADLIENTPSTIQIRRPIVERIEHIVKPWRDINLTSALREIDKL
jgi:hypothetical protein